MQRANTKPPLPKQVSVSQKRSLFKSMSQQSPVVRLGAAVSLLTLQPADSPGGQEDRGGVEVLQKAWGQAGEQAAGKMAPPGGFIGLAKLGDLFHVMQ